MPEGSVQEMYQNALRQLKRIELEVVGLVARLDEKPAGNKQILDDYRCLLLKVREATGVHESLGRLMVWPGDDSGEKPSMDVVIQLNRAAVVQVVAYITASHYVSQWPHAIGPDERPPLEDARHMLAAGQMWRKRIDMGYARRTITRLKRWVGAGEPMGGADLDSRVDAALHGQHAVAALGRINLACIAAADPQERTPAAELFTMGVRHLQERQLGYTSLTALAPHEMLWACARLELVLAVENSSADVYLAKAVLSAVRVACYMSAAERLWELEGKTRDVAGCVREMRKEMSRARRMLAECRRHWWWDVVRRVKRPPASPLRMKITLAEARAAVDEFAQLMKTRKLVFLQSRRKGSAAKTYKQMVVDASRKLLGLAPAPAEQKGAAAGGHKRAA